MTRRLLIVIILITGSFTATHAQEKSLTESISAGQQVYASNCMSCHMENGEGVEGAFPTLVKTEFVIGDVQRLVKIIAHGQTGEITVNGTVYNMEMPTQGHLSDQEIADVANYIRNSWGNKSKKAVSITDVAKVR